MSPFRPHSLVPGHRIEVEIVQQGRRPALVVGVLDSVPDTTHGRALKIRVCDVRITPLLAASVVEPQ